MSITAIEKRLCPTTYQVAPGKEINENATDFAEYIVQSVDFQKTLELVAEILYNAATQNAKNSRTIALVCEEIVRQVARAEENGHSHAQTVEQHIAKDASHDFQSAWSQGQLRSFLLKLKENTRVGQRPLQPSDSDLSFGDWDSDERKKSLWRASIYLSDLYAVGIVQFSTLWECIQVLVKRLARYEHLVILLAMLSRALSYKGEKPPTWFAKDVIDSVRKRCEEVFFELDRLEEEMVLQRFFDRHSVLVGDLASWASPYWTKEETKTRHVENSPEEYDIGTMLVNGRGYLENYQQMRFYDLRERAMSVSNITRAEDTVKVDQIIKVIEVKLNLDDLFEEEENLLELEGLQLRRLE
ncbi:hypothetical protein EST38_g7178 [Candolleomyces aberdarensis]|uniref:Uncharacterized protein n=1 Tax=Candolleomyces aberdarensis TaxID=2316362 RepID=A0A4Q2DHX4_9AGAR|nr:hypothetical protein EST38_g7178 [Candolleomyces aberdarensis]